MKKLLWLIFLVSCYQRPMIDVNTAELFSLLQSEMEFEHAVSQEIDRVQIAQFYGLSMQTVETAYCAYDSDLSKTDRLLLVKGKDTQSMPAIEDALFNYRMQLKSAWELENIVEYKKIESYILKTKGIYVILLISNRAKELIQLFDQAFETNKNKTYVVGNKDAKYKKGGLAFEKMFIN